MRIRVVIPTYNNVLLTLGTLDSLRRELPDPDIVLVDNGSTDNTLGALRADTDQPGSGIRMIMNPVPRAYSRSINMGAAAAGAWDVLIVVNNDTVFAPGSIAELLAPLGPQCELTIPLSPRCVATAGMAPPRISRPGDLAGVYANYEAVATWAAANMGSFGGSAAVGHPYVPQGGYCFAIARRLWERLGGMDEAYELFGEDYDLFDRAGRHTKLRQARGAYVEHLEHQSVAWLGLERDVRMCRSRFLLAERREGLRELVSVVVPTYNRTDALFEAIDSVIAQRMPHWRLYVVDDGSKDWDRIQSAAMARYRGMESRIWFFHLERNAGPGAARNFGLDVGRGKYFAFLDSDDVWAPDHLEKALRIHEAGEVAMSYSPTEFAWRWWDDKHGRFMYRRDRHPEAQLHDPRFTRERLERENFIKTSSVVVWGGLVRRDDEWSTPIRFPVVDDHRMGAEDWVFFREIADRGPVVMEPTSTARTHWSKRADEEAHHSSRLNPFADFGAPPADWLARQVAAVESDPPKASLTVVIPTRDRPAECMRAVRSLPEDLPIVLVADGAASERYVAVLGASARIAAAVVDQPKGPSFARNRGAELAPTDWVWFLDDDDVALPGAAAIAEPYLAGADVIIGELLVGTADELITADGLYTSGLMVRREFFQRAGGFDESSRWAEERELLQRLEAAGGRVVRLGLPIAIKTARASRSQAVTRIDRAAAPQRFRAH